MTSTTAGRRPDQKRVQARARSQGWILHDDSIFQGAAAALPGWLNDYFLSSCRDLS